MAEPNFSVCRGCSGVKNALPSPQFPEQVEELKLPLILPWSPRGPSLTLLPRLERSDVTSAHCNLRPLRFKQFSCLSLPQTGLPHVGQAVLLLLTSDAVCLSPRLEFNDVISAHCQLRFLGLSNYVGTSMGSKNGLSREWSCGTSQHIESCSVAQAGVQRHNLSSLQLLPPGFNLLSSCDCRHVPPCPARFSVEMRFHCVSQNGLNPPTLASQSAGITGMSHLPSLSFLTNFKKK
ncbi:UPF0764 protein C16orf89 [Plecturocebus cupreus]